MASSSLSNNLIFFVCLFMFTFSSSSNLVTGVSDKVQLNLYYESLCPGCQEFIVNDLVKIYNSDLNKITDLKLIPFGNAHVFDNLTVTCQHGEEECKINALEACVIRTYPNPMSHYSIIRCIENDTTDWKSCFKAYGSEQDHVDDCYNGDLSKQLIIGYAKQTLSLKPELQYVPWLTLNGKPLYDKINDFVAQVCNAYKGKTPLPKLCKSPKKKMSKLQVSFADKAINY